MMIGFRMDGHENMRDKVGWNSLEKQDHESNPNINRKTCKSQIVMNEKLWKRKEKFHYTCKTLVMKLVFNNYIKIN